MQYLMATNINHINKSKNIYPMKNKTIETEDYKLIHGDCVTEIKTFLMNQFL